MKENVAKAAERRNAMSKAELFSTSFRGYDKSEVTAFITSQSEAAEVKEKEYTEEIAQLNEKNSELLEKIEELNNKNFDLCNENELALKKATESFDSERKSYEQRIRELEDQLILKNENTQKAIEEAEKEAKLIIEAAQLQKRLIIEAANADASVFVNEKVNYLKERVAKFNEILDTFSAKQQIIDSGFEQARRHLSGINAMMDQMVKNG